MPQRKYSSEVEYVPLIKRIEKWIENHDMPFFSVEFFPPKTKGAVYNLIDRFDRFHQLRPLFADITWHAAGNPESEEATSSITIAGIALNYCGLNTMLHITCIGMTRERLHKCLERAKTIGIRNILALRGDKHCNVDATDFHYASDLVAYIRQHYGDYFTIAVAGYPTKHPESPSKHHDLQYLKAKVDAGADLIITQLFFESKVFVEFVRQCREMGITVPIIPGIMPIQNYDSLEKITRVSQLTIPKQIMIELEPIKNNDEAVRNYGIEWTIRLCRELIKLNCAIGLHFYTLNREQATMSIVKALNLVGSSPLKRLPWLEPANHRRCNETVRPIFWSTRPKSYVCRTKTWDEFPNGRWGNIDSPAFGNLNDYYLFLEPKKKKEILRDMWSHELHSERDVWNIFYCYITGCPNKHSKQVEAIPWNDKQLCPETKLIVDKLGYLNQNGILTINSQPNVNGADSTDPVFGWGCARGYVYQKAYLEFFISHLLANKLLQVLAKYPQVNYQMVNQKGNKYYSNISESEPIAVTWGVFPGKEIIQPTIVDAVSFQVWKDEAFSLWLNKWGCIYEKNSESRAILQNIHDNYYLVNLVDNDYPKENCLWKLLEETMQ